MQHPDEGTIHSWLDGALPAAEAESVEAHVATCQSCAAAVAEARGFIAASSRILTALDDVPRGVLPAVPERKRDLRVFWRSAAAMLVVAGGSLVVMRAGGPDASVSPPSAEIVQPKVGSGSSVAQVDESAAREPRAPFESERRDRTKVAAARDLSAKAERPRPQEPAGGIAGGISADAVAPASAPAPTAANASVAEGERALKVLGVARLAGARQTTYEIAPGQTVTLTEREPAFLSAPVATAQGAAQPMVLRDGRAAQPSRVEAAAASPPPPASDSRAGMDSAIEGRVAGVARPPVAPRKTALTFGAGLQTITWTEVTTGKTLVLTGNLSVERLQEIRLRIEKERAATGVKIP
ncbi:MAG TPA: zf-HC2 domain-containing protein [Gemmatimonadaceae bacterium]|nr:zf-HC2 domain-containing protein [Gemmatimonadaceae bacterium]